MLDESLLDIATTEDLKRLWSDLREISTWTAKCFVAANLNLEIAQPLQLERKEGRIKNKWDSQVCNQMGYYYRALWEVIQVGFPTISQELGNAADTAYDLFCKILQEDREYVFLERAYGDYCLILVDERRGLYGKMLTSDQFSEKQVDKLFNDQRVYRGKWFEQIMPILDRASEGNRQIKARLKALDTEYQSLAELIEEALGARGSQGKIHKSEEWHNGRRTVFQGNKPPSSKRYKT